MMLNIVSHLDNSNHNHNEIAVNTPSKMGIFLKNTLMRI